MFKFGVNIAKGLDKVTAWKDSQYAMMKNITSYADLKPFDQGDQDALCRRSHIMAVFGTQAGAIGNDVKCNFCDNCGYNNNWNVGASDIVAGIKEQEFRNDLREFLLMESKNDDYLIQNLDLF